LHQRLLAWWGLHGRDDIPWMLRLHGVLVAEVMPEPVAGYAGLAAAGLHQEVLVQ
jgi:hypothetical protein